MSVAAPGIANDTIERVAATREAFFETERMVFDEHSPDAPEHRARDLADGVTHAVLGSSNPHLYSLVWADVYERAFELLIHMIEDEAQVEHRLSRVTAIVEERHFGLTQTRGEGLTYAEVYGYAVAYTEYMIDRKFDEVRRSMLETGQRVADAHRRSAGAWFLRRRPFPRFALARPLPRRQRNRERAVRRRVAIPRGSPARPRGDPDPSASSPPQEGVHVDQTVRSVEVAA